MKTNITYGMIALVILIAGATGVRAFWGTKSCQDGNEIQCLKEVKDFKKQYDKKELKAIKITEEISDTQKEIDKWEAIKLEQETERGVIETEMGEISNKASVPKQKLYDMGFGNS